MLNRVQHNYLLEPINPGRVQKDGKQKSHVQAWDVRRHLIRVFGFGGYDVDTVKIELIAQIDNGGRWTVIYRADVRVTVKNADGTELAHYEDSATGDAINQPSLGDAHDLALKTALSQAMKRCAVNLGDQFGLSLYNKGNQEAVVRSAFHPEIVAERAAVTPDVEDEPVVGEEIERPGGEEPQNPEAIVLAQKFTDEIRAAASKSELTAVARDIKAAVETGGIGTFAREILAELWQERKEALITEGIWQ